MDVAWGEVNRYRFGDVDLPGEGAVGQLGAYRVQTFDALPDERVRVAGWGKDAAEHAGFGDAWVLLVHFTRPVKAWSVLLFQTIPLTSMNPLVLLKTPVRKRVVLVASIVKLPKVPLGWMVA